MSFRPESLNWSRRSGADRRPIANDISSSRQCDGTQLVADLLMRPGVGKVLRANARYFFGGGADASCFVNLMVIDFFSPEPSFMNSVNV